MGTKTITRKQKAYVENVAKGIEKDRSAIMAGSTAKSQNQFEKSVVVQEELARVRKEAIENTGITKEVVANMFIEAANMARIIGDPMGLIAAARELGKMLGHYAPEIKKLEQSINARDLKKALKDMNDEELYKLAHARTIDGESKIVPDVPGDETSNKLLPAPTELQGLHT